MCSVSLSECQETEVETEVETHEGGLAWFGSGDKNLMQEVAKYEAEFFKSLYRNIASHGALSDVQPRSLRRVRGSRFMDSADERPQAGFCRLWAQNGLPFGHCLGRSPGGVRHQVRRTRQPYLVRNNSDIFKSTWQYQKYRWHEGLWGPVWRLLPTHPPTHPFPRVTLRTSRSGID